MSTVQFDNFQQVWDHAVSNGGGTFAIETHHSRRFITEAGFTSGYYVATKGNEWLYESGEFTPEVIQAYVATHLPLLTNARHGDYLLGIWEDNGYWYLDVSEFVSSHSKAVKLGLERNQLAIWDIAEGDEFSLRLVSA